MATMVQPVEALSVDPILDIMEDDTLSWGEKLRFIEGLFVHDSPQPHQEQYAGITPGAGAKPGG